MPALLPVRPAVRVLFVAAALVLLGPTAARAKNSLDGEVAARAASVAQLAGKPEAIVPLLGVLDLWPDVDDRKAIAALLDSVGGDPRQLPEVRARATFLRSILDERAGDFEAARKRRAALGFVTTWQVLGPFDDEGKAGDKAELPPEKDLTGPVDARQEYTGKDRPVRWRPFPPSLISQGMIQLDAALRPDQHVLAYATAWIRVARPTWVAVRSGSTGAIGVWVNGRAVVTRDAYRPVRMDQDAGMARLEAGWNRVTVKLGAQEGGWAFFLRLTLPDGSPLQFEASADPKPAAVGTRGRGRRRPAPAAPLLADLGAALKRAVDTGGAEAARAYGLYLQFVSPLDPVQGEAERILRFAAEAKPSTEAWRLAAAAAPDAEKRRKDLEAATAPALLQAATPFQRARALLELGDVYAHLHRERRAEALWREAAAADPGLITPRVRLAGLMADRGLPALAYADLVELAGRSGAVSVMRALAAMADRRGQRDEAERRWKALVQLAADDLIALRELLVLARSRGDLEGALGLVDRIAKARPAYGAIAIERADLLDSVGRSAEAHEVLTRALADCPDDPRLLERDGRILQRLGQEAGAIAAVRRALELRPQNPDLRAYLGFLEAKGQREKVRAADDLARKWSAPVDELIAEGRRPGVPVPKGPARVLLDRSVTRVHPNGLSESFNQRVVEILDARGAREEGNAAIRYTPDTQAVEVKAAHIYKRSGAVVEAPATTDQDTSEPWYGLYYDTRAQVITLPGLEPGDVVDIEYVISDVANRNMFANYFGEVHALQEDMPRRRSEYVLVTPKSRVFYFNEPKLPGLKRSESVQGDERVYQFRADDVPKVAAEPGMPGFTSVAAYVHVSTYRTWEEVAEWYTGLVRSQLETDDAIKRAVRGAIKGISDEREKVRAIYDLVVKQTRYVGLEFGIHGYKPYAVTQVFQRKFGDCKDKASLLVAMLREAGIEASLVLARTRRNGDIDPFPASLAPFDHAIAWVPKYDLFLDGTAEFSGSDELPSSDQDIPVLIVRDPRVGGKGRLLRTPVLPAERNRLTRDSEVRLAEDGGADVALEVTVSGQSASQWRNHYQNPGERRERFEKGENAAHPGTRVNRVDFRALEDLEKSVEARAALSVPGWARVEGKSLVMPALGREGEMLRSYARLSTRKHDLVIGFPWQQEERVRLHVPKGWAPSRLPEPRKVESPFGTFEVTVERKGDDVRVVSLLRILRHRVSAAEYPAFRRFCLDVDAAMGQRLVIAHD